MFFQHWHLSVPLGSNMHQNCLFMWMYSPLEQEAHSCKSVLRRVQQKFNFLDWMCFQVPSCRIRAAKRRSKIPCKYVYYLHMGGSWGSLKLFAASNFLIFILFYFRPFISLDFSIQSKFNLSFFWKYAPRSGGKHNSRDRHTPTWTLKIACSAVRTHYWRHHGAVFRILIVHRGKACLQKTIANCALFLQFSSLRLALAALADKSIISSSMVIVFSRSYYFSDNICPSYPRATLKILIAAKRRRRETRTKNTK